MTAIPVQRDPMDFSPEVWAPAGTAGEHVAARVIAAGDQVLVHRAFGVWMLSHAKETHRTSVWANVCSRNRRVFTVRIDHETTYEVQKVSVLNLDVKVVRRISDPKAREIMTLAASGRADAVDLALECAFPSQPRHAQGWDDQEIHILVGDTQETVCGAAAGYEDAPSGPDKVCRCCRTLETVRDKVNGHLEAAENRMSTSVGTPYYRECLAAYVALKALKADLGF